MAASVPTVTMASRTARAKDWEGKRQPLALKPAHGIKRNRHDHGFGFIIHGAIITVHNNPCCHSSYLGKYAHLAVGGSVSGRDGGDDSQFQPICPIEHGHRDLNVPSGDLGNRSASSAAGRSAASVADTVSSPRQILMTPICRPVQSIWRFSRFFLDVCLNLNRDGPWSRQRPDRPLDGVCGHQLCPAQAIPVWGALQGGRLPRSGGPRGGHCRCSTPLTTVTSASAPAEGRRLEHCSIDMLHTPSDGRDWDGYTELSRTRFNYGGKILRRTELSVRGPSYKRETLSGLTFVATLTRPGIRQATLQPCQRTPAQHGIRDVYGRSQVKGS